MAVKPFKEDIPDAPLAASKFVATPFEQAVISIYAPLLEPPDSKNLNLF